MTSLKSCSSKPPPVPKGRTPGEPFVPKSRKGAEMEKMLKSMEDMPGAPGMKMYLRDLMNNMENLGRMKYTPLKLGKVLIEKEMKKDWKQKITKGIQNTSEALMQQASKVSHRVRQWWRKESRFPKIYSKAEL